MGEGQAAHISHVDAKQRSHLRIRLQLLGLGPPVPPQSAEVHPLFPIHSHDSVCRWYYDLISFDSV